MIKNYFKTAWRNLWKNKFYTSINILGLAIGLAVGLIILLWVKDETSYDRFHTKSDNIYRVSARVGSGGTSQVWAGIPAPIATYSKKELLEVQEAVRIIDNYDNTVFRYGDKLFEKTKTAYVDQSFFTLFDFKLVSGNQAKPFPDKNAIIISRSTAQKYFGTENPVGKVITANNKDAYNVQGVMEDFPENSSLRYDMLFSTEWVSKNYEPNDYWKSMEEDWGNYYCTTFLLVRPDASIPNMEKKITQIHRSHNKEDQTTSFLTLPLAKIHLYNTDGSSGAMQMVRIFFVVAILLLLIACINYVNLSTARSMVRAKEVSVRKIIGAGRVQLFMQFITETIILFAIATALAILIIYGLMPMYNKLAEKHATFDIADASVWSTIGLTILGTLIAASIYPALLLSSFKPIQALKGKISIGIGNTRFRQVLVVTQFSFSVILIIGTLIIGRQMRYIQEKQLGFDKSYVFTLSMRDMQGHYEAIRTELLKQPGITGVTSANNNIVQIGSTTGDTDWEGKEPNSSFMIHPMSIAANFIPEMKLQLVAGQGFKGEGKTDSAKVILNETAVREAGIKDPIGKSFTLWQTRSTIIGVVKDFHFTSLKTRIEPLILYYRPDSYIMYVKTTGKDAPKAIAAVEKYWKQYNADFPFQYRFLDESYDRMYRSDRVTNTLFNVFALIAILISCLGLFGLATYTAQVKTREIGIRKVLGASVAHVTGLLAKDFVKLVLIAIVIASPLAWLAMNKWLQDFQYRVTIGVWVFLVAGAIALFIALLTVSSQAIRAALINPVKSLKSNE